MGSVKSDLDETLSVLFQILQILMWYQPYGLKSASKGVNEENKSKEKPNFNNFLLKVGANFSTPRLGVILLI